MSNNNLLLLCGLNCIIVFSELENVLSTEQCRYNVPTKNKNLPTNIQQAVAMSNNEDMEIDVDRTDDSNKINEARGNEARTRDVNEKERESRYSERKVKNPINITDKQDTAMTKTRRTGPLSEEITNKTSARMTWQQTA
jgi:hypothetical protein